MSKDALFLYDPGIPGFEKKDDTPLRFRFHIPTRVISTLGTGGFNANSGGLTLSALAIARKCIVTKGYTNSPDEPLEGILLDGGITIVDENGDRGTIGKEIWTLSATTDSFNPDEILKDAIMGVSGDLVSRVDMIIAGYMKQEEDQRRAINDGYRRARGDALEARNGTFGGGY